MVFQIVFIVLFAIFGKYDYGVDAEHDYDIYKNASDFDNSAQALDSNYMPMFQDVHVMIYVGFGFLMVYMKRYGYSSIGLNMMTAAFTVQWATLMGGFLHLHNGYIDLNIVTLFLADFAAAAVLITFGALLGRLSPVQMLILAFFEIAFFQVNEWIGLSLFQAVDIGGSMFVHIFGAYFGLACSLVLGGAKTVEKFEYKATPTYQSDLFSMIGTMFLWLFWPSFNSALASGNAQHRAVINTYYALAACALCSFAFSAMVNKHDKVEMEHVQNATLAGGVAVGTTADMMIEPWGAMAIGVAASLISVIGFKYLTPFIDHKLKMRDSCGVHNLHGMPGVLAGIAGIIVTTQASFATYSHSLYKIFPAMVPTEGSDEFVALSAFLKVEPGEGRDATTQALYQLAAMGVTLGISLVGGAITGAILKIPIWNRPDSDAIFEDEEFWHVEPFMPEAHTHHDRDHDDYCGDLEKHEKGWVANGNANEGYTMEQEADDYTKI